MRVLAGVKSLIGAVLFTSFLQHIRVADDRRCVGPTGVQFRVSIFGRGTREMRSFGSLRSVAAKCAKAPWSSAGDARNHRVFPSLPPRRVARRVRKVSRFGPGRALRLVFMGTEPSLKRLFS